MTLQYLVHHLMDKKISRVSFPNIKVLCPTRLVNEALRTHRRTYDPESVCDKTSSDIPD